MCSRGEIQPKAGRLAGKLNAIDDTTFPSDEINAFDKPKMPVILCSDPENVHLSEWGLIPSWASQAFNEAHTHNARIETIEEKPAFKQYVNNRCLVIFSAFYEYQEYRNERGTKKKRPYRITRPDAEDFCVAGLYNFYNGKLTHTVVTTEANELMREIHNTTYRMPLVLSLEEEKAWLEGNPFVTFRDRSHIELIATPAWNDPSAEQFNLGFE